MGAPNVQIIGENNRAIEVDGSTHAIETIDYSHHEIHAGSHFYVSGYTAINSGTSVVFAITTPNTAKWAHMVWDIEASGATIWNMKEGAEISSGTAVTAFNNNRNSTATSTLTIVVTPTVTSTGTLIDSAIIGAPGGNPANPGAGGGVGRDSELVLKQNTVYLFSMLSNTASNNINYRGSWYEHTDKE